MAPTPANNIAYTALINPPSATPAITIEQIWKGLEKKITAGQDFVGGALISTDVISTSTDEQGRPVTVREVVFRDGNRRVRETCIAFEPMKVEFHQEDGSKVQNVISHGSEGELFMTYTFEWLHPECAGDVAALEAKKEKEWKIAKMAVDKTIQVMREMVVDGRIK
ncbi:uncharacterized protein Z518_10650 [Rhinocladiella mackenziei CBS 650.93]|uniref:Bet v1-like protein n=1 Tax=Rhinocladiella mackenziei CBS 650.93 TaxID=1442369 RepID=A0A0D2IV02_9EURO|nr:uncharacterized protein Z518_10650 [Rhinocladiella mackenziei CBS 650.93]KIX00510.1 hypothetical protein Z518_10650 [Rhinocladiella mackenziei CBS 650.93]